MKRIRLLLIEDNRLLREGMTQMIRKQPDLDIVAASENFKSVEPAAQKLNPHVVLLDQCLRDQNSLRAVEEIKKIIPQAKVIVMGLIPVRADIVAFVKAGASGFILKEASLRDFLKTIRSVVEGAKVLPPQLTGSLFSQIVEDAARNGKVVPADVRITRRQREIIDLIDKGLTNKEIAQRLHLAVHTVKSHVHNLLEKLALHSRLDVASLVNSRGTPESKSDKIDPVN